MPITTGSNNPYNPLIHNNTQNSPRSNNDNQNNSNIEQPVSAPQVHVSPEVYRAQFVLDDSIRNQFSFSLANDNEILMHEIYEIDKEAFADTDPYENYEDFRSIVSRNGLSAYAVKDNNGELIGYYQLEPIEDGDLYIDSIGLKTELRRTRKGVNAIKYTWNEIQKFARENNAQTLSLHVNAQNRALVRMYQNLGFTISETLNNYYQNGADAYFMTMAVPQSSATAETVQGTVETPSVEETIVEETPELSEEEQAQVLFEEKYTQAKNELISLGLDEEKATNRLSCCVNKKDGIEVFNDDLFECTKYIIQFQNRYQGDDRVFWHNDYTISSYEFDNLLTNLKEKNGRVRTDLLPYLDKFARKGIYVGYYDNIFQASTLRDKNGKENICESALDFALEIAPKAAGHSGCYIKNIIKACKNTTPDGEVFDEDARSCARHSLIYDSTKLEDIDDLLKAATKHDGKYTSFDKSLYDYIELDLKKDYGDRVFYAPFEAERASCAVKDMKTYMNNALEINRSGFLDSVPDELRSKLDYNKKASFLYSVFNACCYETTSQTYYGTRKDIIFDRRAFQAIKELAAKNPPIFNKLEHIPKLVNACKTMSPYGEYKFDRAVLDKALEYIQLGHWLDDWASYLIDACMLKTYDRHTGKMKSCEFSDEIFNIMMERQRDPNCNYFGDGIIKCCIDMVDGKEVFRPERYEQLKNSFISINRNEFSLSNADARIFFTEHDKYNKTFNLELFKKFTEAKMPYELACEKVTLDGSDKTKLVPNETMIDAYTTLNSREIPFTQRPDDCGYDKSAQYYLLYACIDDVNSYKNTKFNTSAYSAVLELLDKGYDGRDVLDVIHICRETKDTGSSYTQIFSPKRYELVKNLLEQGVDILNSAKIAGAHIYDGKINQKAIDDCVELYKLGIKNPVTALSEAKKDPLAFQRTKECVEKNFPQDIIKNCKDRGVFKDSLYMRAVSLLDKGYTPASVNALMQVCHTKETDNIGHVQKTFDEGIFSKISELEQIGIDKENMADILKVCKDRNEKFMPLAFDKISQLHYKSIDDKGIEKFLKIVYEYQNEQTEEKAKWMMGQLSNIKILRDHAHSDSYIVEKLNNYKDSVDIAEKLFGHDVMKNVLNSRIDGYINFSRQCKMIKEKCSEQFIEDLNARLDKLPSPELKVKRLRIIGGLADKVDENALRKLSDMIESPEMTAEQIKITTEIFTDKETDYETKIEKFMTRLHVPKKSQQTVRDYLLKEKLDTKINYPKSIEEQMAQMDVYAQQMLTNPKIPLDKKIKYIDEFKAKKADMQAHPEKYTTPEILAKPLAELKKMVMAHINIPNDDAKFCQSLVTAMYSRCGIDADEDLLRAIRFDAKYFDKLFATTYEFNENFKKLIELKRADFHRSLTELRVELPEENTALYEKFDRLGLIKQIQANLDTKRQYAEHGLNFDKWNSFDKDFKSESFTVEANPEVEFENTKFNLINIFQDENFDKIKQEETQKLLQYLSQYGFVIYNNNIYKNGQQAQKNDIERFAELTKEYIEKNEYWKSATENDNIQLSEEEKTGINGFSDHLKGILHHIEEIKGAKTVHDINFRLSDSNNIGRNIFFGNHVSCCNSAESTYAGYSAPMHLLNAYNRGIELVDKFGNSYGNSNCFFAMIDGKLTFVIDSFEANGDLASNPIVTDKLVEFGKRVCEEMGRSDAQVMIGPSFNHINQSRLKQVNVDNIKVIGTVSALTYCDSVGGLKVLDNINKGVSNKRMFIYQ